MTIGAPRRDAVSSAPVSVLMLMGEQLVRSGKLSDHDIYRIIAMQDRSGQKFGEIAVDLGLVSEADVQEVLADQYSYPSEMVDIEAFHASLVTAVKPASARSESFRTARSEIILRWMSIDNKCLTVTAARARQGASVVSANLAIVFAQMGARTLLIDANLRTPNQHDLFRIEAGPRGLSMLLTQRCALGDVLRPISPYRNLQLLPAGPTPPNPQELLSRPTFTALIERVHADFDVVIVDTPPILDFADARMIAHATGACVLAVQRDVTRIADMDRVKATLQPGGAKLLGAVLSA